MWLKQASTADPPAATAVVWPPRLSQPFNNQVTQLQLCVRNCDRQWEQKVNRRYSGSFDGGRRTFMNSYSKCDGGDGDGDDPALTHGFAMCQALCRHLICTFSFNPVLFIRFADEERGTEAIWQIH